MVQCDPGSLEYGAAVPRPLGSGTATTALPAPMSNYAIPAPVLPYQMIPGMPARVPNVLVPLPGALPGSIPGLAVLNLKNTTVYVGKISEYIDDEFMQQLLGVCGKITKWNRATDPTTKKLVAFGFCEFESSEGVYKAINFLDGKVLGEKELHVKCDDRNKLSLDVWIRQQRKMHLENLKMAEPSLDPVERTDEELDQMIMDGCTATREQLQEMLEARNDLYEKTAPDREKQERDKLDRERDDRRRRERDEEMRLERERRDKDGDSDVERRKTRDVDDDRKRRMRRLRSNPRQRERENRRKEREKLQELEQTRLRRDYERKEERRIREYKEALDQLKIPGEREKKRLIQKEVRDAKRMKPLTPAEEKERKRRMEKERERDEEDALCEARELDEKESARRDEEDRVEEERREEDKRRARADRKDKDRDRDRDSYRRDKRDNERDDRNRQDKREHEQERKVREELHASTLPPPIATPIPVPPPGMPPIGLPPALELQTTERKEELLQASVASFSMQKKVQETGTLSLFEAADDANRKHAPLQKLENPSDKVNKQKEQDVKTLIAQIPTSKREVFAFPIDWENVRVHNIIETKLKPWVRKKVIEYLGAEEITMIEFILNKVESASKGGDGPDHILTELESFIDEEAEQFVLKMWRMIIFENLRVKKN